MLRPARAPAAAREVAAVRTRPLLKAAPGPPGPKRSGRAILRRRDPRRRCAARRGPPEPAGLPARGETRSSDREERTCRPQPRAWESLFGVLEQCLRSRMSLSLPPQKPTHFPGSLWLQPRKSRRPQALRVLVTGSLVLPGLFLHLLHDPAISLRQPITIGRKRCRAKGDACWSFPLVTGCFFFFFFFFAKNTLLSVTSGSSLPSLPYGLHKRAVFGSGKEKPSSDYVDLIKSVGILAESGTGWRRSLFRSTMEGSHTALFSCSSSAGAWLQTEA
ncbi:uncharacterized protein LOC116529104 [Sapajus apella]|uniref:Uncharacterized protein LOC116529104 n=1 Tax=Sapajus apella TaxID=9515 RepID=A0A6J3FA70_SAPAP|nr:uncharacterized protein LOC116529104 [Sapajus apella]